MDNAQELVARAEAPIVRDPAICGVQYRLNNGFGFGAVTTICVGRLVPWGSATRACDACGRIEQVLEPVFVVEWWQAPMPPIAPDRVLVRKGLLSFADAVQFIVRLPSDAELVSLVEHSTVLVDRTNELSEALLSAKTCGRALPEHMQVHEEPRGRGNTNGR